MYGMIKYVKFLIIVFIVINFSCNNSKDSKNLSFREFNKKVNMEDRFVEKLSLKGCYNPSSVHVFDTLLIVTQKRIEKGIFSFYSLKNHKLLASFGKQGKGPGEFIAPAITNVDKHNKWLWFIDYPKTTFYAFSIQEILKGPRNIKPVKVIKFNQSLMPVFTYKVLADTSILLSSSNNSSLLTLINSKGEIIETYGEQPMFDSPDLPERVYRSLHSRFLTYNDKTDEVVLSYLYYDKLLKYNLTTGEYLITTGPDNIKQKAKAKEDGSMYRPITLIKGYFYTMTSDDVGVFALYTGDTHFNEDLSGNYPNNIYVFDWDFNPKFNLIFKRNIKIYDIDYENNNLYTITGEGNINVYRLP